MSGNNLPAAKRQRNPFKLDMRVYEGKIIASRAHGIVYVDSVMPSGEIIIQGLSKLFLGKRANVQKASLLNVDESKQEKIDSIIGNAGNLNPEQMCKEPKILSFIDEHNLDTKSFANKLKLYILAQEIHN